VAGILQFIDFDNETTKKVTRIVVIVITVIFAILIFMYLQLHGAFKKLKKAATQQV